MKILLIGANSYVGARLYFDLKDSFHVTGTFSNHSLSNDFIHLDITRPDEVLDCIKNIKPEIIIHAANNASSRWCDANPELAIQLNQESTKTIIDTSKTNNCKIVYISSMSVFDQTTLYGQTKLASETIVQHSSIPYLILRPWLILGLSPNTTNDRPFNRILKNIDERTPAIYDTSWKFQPTYLHHISEVIERCIVKDIWNQIISIAVPEKSTRFQTATDILAPFGIHVLPVDEHKKESYTNPLSELTELKLPKYSYKQMIACIIDEIKNLSSFTLS